MDIDLRLEDSDLFEWVEVKRESSPECMITAVCKAKPASDLTILKHEIERIWMDYLRYDRFERHCVNDSADGFTFHFVTYTIGLGIVGEIQCRK